MGSPRSRMRPDAMVALPATALKSVLLPAPFGPMRAQTSPSATSKVTRSTAVNPPKRTVTSVSSRSAGMSLPEIAVVEHRVHAREQAREAARQEQDDRDDEHREQQLLQPRQVPKEFRCRGEERRSQNGAEQAAEPAHHDELGRAHV